MKPYRLISQRKRKRTFFPEEVKTFCKDKNAKIWFAHNGAWWVHIANSENGFLKATQEGLDFEKAKNSPAIRDLEKVWSRRRIAFERKA